MLPNKTIFEPQKENLATLKSVEAIMEETDRTIVPVEIGRASCRERV